MDQQQLQDLGHKFTDALHVVDKGDGQGIDEIVALFSDDAHLTNAALILAGEERTGSEGVRQFWTEYSRILRDVETIFHHVTTDDSAVGLFWTTTGTDAAGESIAYDGVSLLEYNDNGKITAFHGYYDTRQLNRTVNATDN